MSDKENEEKDFHPNKYYSTPVKRNKPGSPCIYDSDESLSSVSPPIDERIQNIFDTDESLLNMSDTEETFSMRDKAKYRPNILENNEEEMNETEEPNKEDIDPSHEETLIQDGTKEVFTSETIEKESCKNVPINLTKEIVKLKKTVKYRNQSNAEIEEDDIGGRRLRDSDEDNFPIDLTIKKPLKYVCFEIQNLL